MGGNFPPHHVYYIVRVKCAHALNIEGLIADGQVYHFWHYLIIEYNNILPSLASYNYRPIPHTLINFAVLSLHARGKQQN